MKSAASFMDEVDGRPGHVALQSGHLDAPQDVSNLSLCLAPPHKSGAPRLAFETRVNAALLRTVIHQNEHRQGDTHENLPGK
jgi:hypothetical protein